VAYDEQLAERVRALLGGRLDLDERRMFGGLAFLIAGNMCCGVHGDRLSVRLFYEDAAELLERERGARPFDLTGRPMRGWLLVAPEAVADDADLERWVRRGEAFAASLRPR
jgi:TfoX N-terminal domain